MSKELFMVSYDGKKVVMETKLKCASFDGDRKCLCFSGSDEINNSINSLKAIYIYYFVNIYILSPFSMK